jgi:signal transduction histidine kinase
MQNIQVVILLAVALVNVMLALMVIFGQKNIVGRVYSLFALLLSFWALGLAGFINASSLESALYFANSYYIIGTSFVCLFLLFSRVFPNNRGLTMNDYAVTLSPIILVLILFSFDKNLFLQQIIPFIGGKDVVMNSLNYFFFVIFIGVYLSLSFKNLLIGKRSTDNRTEKKQFDVIIGGTSVAWAFGVVFNIIFPLFGNYRLIWLGPVFTIIMVASIAYAISKHHLFNTKVIATEILTFGLWFFLFIRTILSSGSYDLVTNASLLVVTMIVGILLVRSVLKEVNSRERIERLAKDLESANEELRQLDQRKSEFLSIASHQLRSPITAMKGYSSMILEGSYGPISDKVKDAVDKIYQSSTRIAVIVDDFLSVTRIELGTFGYDFKNIDIREIVKSVAEEQSPAVARAKLEIRVQNDSAEPCLIRADSGKIRQVVGNLIDNAIKYTPKGGIDITVRANKQAKKVTVTLKDTGVGIPIKESGRIFEKFTRAGNASSVNTSGSGLGLYVAREIVKAHNGRIWAESEGEGKGSAFYVEFPIVSA